MRKNLTPHQRGVLAILGQYPDKLLAPARIGQLLKQSDFPLVRRVDSAVPSSWVCPRLARLRELGLVERIVNRGVKYKITEEGREVLSRGGTFR